MSFWNIDLDDWIRRRHFDESISAYALRTVVGTIIIIVGIMNIQNFMISLNGIRQISQRKKIY